MVAFVRPLVACLGLILLLSAPAAAQNSTPNPGARLPPPLTTSLRDLGVLLARVPELSPAIAFDRRRAAATVTRLQQLSVNWPAESPIDYRANVARETTALALAIQKADLLSLGATLEALADDLQIKLEHCTKSGGKLGGSVAVRVRSVRDGNEVKGWEVRYLTRVLEVAGNAEPERFSQLSSPATEPLPPGRYVMWLRDPASNRMGERTTIKVGEGVKEKLVDLTVPVTPPR
jgi:hypothetical protein